MENKNRCAWSEKDDLYRHYHDNEWGNPVFDDQKLFEFLILETFQAGVSWHLILKKRENFRKSFLNFDYQQIALFSDFEIQELMNDAGIIRNSLKIKSAVANAKAFIKIQEEFGSFSTYIWSFVDGKPIENQFTELAQVPAYTPLAEKISKELKKLNNYKHKKIHPSAVVKVRAGLMYYRLGCESNELHSKLLNYWIGMEFIFSAYESSENTIPRLKKYYSKMHGLLLFKRILLSFHSNIQNLEVASHFVNYKLDDIEYLMVKDNYDNAIGLMKTHPLFAYRAKMIKELFDDPKRISKMVHKSLDNMKRNLTRIYRIRNEIVHNASSISGMETVVSHMKFYLLFTIYSVIQFFDERADDFNFDGRIDIDDFFEIRELKFDNMFPKSDTNIEIEKLKLLKMPMEELFYPRS